MITDEVFKKELDSLFKRQGIRKISERHAYINIALIQPIENRNAILENAELRAREYELQKKQLKKIKSEFEEQCLFVAWFKKEFPYVKIMSIRNHGIRTPREKVDQMREGLLPGAADLYVPRWHLWIEFKRSKGGVLSDEQAIFRDYVQIECNDNYILANGFEDGRLALLDFLGKI